MLNSEVSVATLVEACVASHCHRLGRTFYFKGLGELDVTRIINNKQYQAIEVKWAKQIKPADLKILQHLKDSIILTKGQTGKVDCVMAMPVYQFLFDLV